MPILNSCGGMLKPAPAKGVPVNVKDRVKQNIEQGRGFRIMGNEKGGTFDFASSNELWRAALDSIDFMPLVSANYSGGIIVTDWYSEQHSDTESVKISIRFLTNEIRADALNIKVFKRICPKPNECKMTETGNELIKELKKTILKKAAIYEDENRKKKAKPYFGEVQ